MKALPSGLPSFLLRIALGFSLALACGGALTAAPLATLEIVSPAPGNSSTLTAGTDANLYGTTPNGGAFGAGTIFRMTLDGQITILKSFEESTASSSAADGSHPVAPLVRGPDGRFYGSTTSGGDPSHPASPSAFGTIFAITSGGQFQKIANVPAESYFASFSTGLVTGTVIAPLTFGQNGYIYGTTKVSIFKLSLSGDFTKLVSMPPNDFHGGRAKAPVIVASGDGKFYGTANAGDVFSPEYAFVMTADGATTRLADLDPTFQTGNLPIAPLLEATDGNFYGLGPRSDIFRMTRTGTVTFLHQFQGPDGSVPEGGLIQGPDGNFYGVTSEEWRNDPGGTVYRLTPDGTVTTLASFNAITGSTPKAALVIGSDGCFYGTTSTNGPTGTGSIFRLTIFPPRISAVVPYSQQEQRKLVIHGQFFSQASSVTVDGKPVSYFAVDSPTQITAILLPGQESGVVTVTTALGSGSLAYGSAASGSVVNLSSRLMVFAGDNALIAGFIISGSGNKKLMLRGIGPSLETAGVSGALQDPTLELHDQQGTIIGSNDNWRTTQIGGVITADQTTEIKNTGIAPTDDRESAMVATLPAGSYTAVQRGKNDTIGVGLIELYDLSAPGSQAKLGNISTRGLVLGENIIIGGFIAGSPSSSRVLVRGIGPSLTGSGVTNALPDPTIDLRDSNGAQVAFNNDWRDSQEQEITDTTLPPRAAKESAIVATLAPGNYTALVRGQNGSSGVGLVEIFALGH